MFQQPSAGGDKLPVADIEGRLVLVTVHKHEKDIVTTFGTRDAVRVDVVVLDGPDAPQEHDDVLWFGAALVGSLKGAIGEQPVLGRIGKGVAKPGQSAPWILQPFTDTDAQIATAYVNSRPAPFQAPATATPATAPALAAVPAIPAGPLDPNNLPADVKALVEQLAAQQAAATATG